MVLRAWRGLKTEATPLADFFLGDASKRPDLIRSAEMAVDVKKKLSASQRQHIMQIAKPITIWSFIAGFGKTYMLAIVVKMITLQCPKAVVWITAATNRVSAEIEAVVTPSLKEDQILILRLVPEH